MLDQRVSAAAEALLGDTGADAGEPGLAAAGILPRLVELARTTSSSSVLWLVLTATSGRFPTADTVRRLQRALQFDPPEEIERIILWTAITSADKSRLDLPMRIVSRPLIDVDTSGRSDYQSGIHRVVRETVARWVERHDVELAIWDDTYALYRSAAPRERARITQYGAPVTAELPDARYTPEMIVPWNTVVVLPDVPIGGPAEALTGLALCSGNRLTAIGYDLLPITSAETRPLHDVAAAGEWLVPLKAAERVAAISESATQEFKGYAQTLTAQGLAGPLVEEVRLPGGAPPDWFTIPERTDRDVPRLVFSGTREPHKNHRSLLYAAERLWAEGHAIEVRMVGGNSWTDEHLADTIERLIAEGRALVDVGRVSERALWSELATADGVVFA